MGRKQTCGTTAKQKLFWNLGHRWPENVNCELTLGHRKKGNFHVVRACKPFVGATNFQVL
jgi:hypothetical protein